MPQNVITTNRLILKPYEEKDQAYMLELLTNEEIKKTFMIPDFSSPDEAITMFHKRKAASLSNNHYEYGIYLDKKLIGFVNEVEKCNDSIELGYVIDPKYQKKGYASEVLQAVIQDLFRLGYTNVYTGAFENNTASIRVMEKCGMKAIEKTEDIIYHGRKQHCIYYEISNI